MGNIERKEYWKGKNISIFNGEYWKGKKQAIHDFANFLEVIDDGTAINFIEIPIW